MLYFVSSLLLAWLPPRSLVIALGVIAIFVIVTILRIVALILDVIPFL